MARFANNHAEAWWYVLKADRELPPEEQSRFLLKPVTIAERMRLLDDFRWDVRSGEGPVISKSRNFQQTYELALANILRAENCPAGAPVPWPEGQAEREAYLSKMDPMDVFEIGNAIRDSARLESAPPADGKRGTPEEEAAVAKNS